MIADVPLLRRSFALVAAREPALTKRFTQILFARYPQAQRLFSPRRQARLTHALVTLLDHLEDASWLTTALPALGAKQVGYGVTDEMYGWFGECLLATLAEVAGADWSHALELAWSGAYTAVAELMMSGARTAMATTLSMPATRVR